MPLILSFCQSSGERHLRDGNSDAQSFTVKLGPTVRPGVIRDNGDGQGGIRNGGSLKSWLKHRILLGFGEGAQFFQRDRAFLGWHSNDSSPPCFTLPNGFGKTVPCELGQPNGFRAPVNGGFARMVNALKWKFHVALYALHHESSPMPQFNLCRVVRNRQWKRVRPLEAIQSELLDPNLTTYWPRNELPVCGVAHSEVGRGCGILVTSCALFMITMPSFHETGAL